MSKINAAGLSKHGVPLAVVKSILQRIARDGKDIHSFMLMRGGEVLWQNGFAPHTIDTVHNLFSVSKSFTSALIGIAQDKGLLSINETFASIFPDKLPENPGDNLLNMTLRNALTMATGHDVEPF